MLAGFVAPGARVLEIASGTGEHAVFLAPRLEVASWQPSDPSAEACASIDAHREGEPRVLPAMRLDVRTPPATLAGPFDLVVCVNMIHIAPFEACEALAARAGEWLAPEGHLYLYGPYRVGGTMAPSNEAFDASLRARDPSWGVRDLEVVTDVMARAGLRREAVTAMPANNVSLVFKRS